MILEETTGVRTQSQMFDKFWFLTKQKKKKQKVYAGYSQLISTTIQLRYMELNRSIAIAEKKRIIYEMQ